LFELDTENKKFWFEFFMPFVFGLAFFLLEWQIATLFDCAPLRAPDYSVIISVTGLILALMFPMSVFLKGKKDDILLGRMKLRAVALFTDNENGKKDEYNDEIEREEFSVSAWMNFFVFVTLIPATVSINLFWLWGGFFMFARGQYAISLHLIIFSCVMSTFYVLYNREWAGIFWSKIFLFREDEKNKKRFQKFTKRINLTSLKSISIDDLLEIPRHREFKRRACPYIFIGRSSAAWVLSSGFLGWGISYFLDETYRGAKFGGFTFLLLFLVLFLLSYISTYLLGVLSRADNLFLARFFTAIGYSIIFTTISIIATQLFFHGLHKTAYFMGLIFLVGNVFSSWKWRSVQYEKIKKYILKVVDSGSAIVPEGISSYFISVMNAMILKNKRYKYQIKLEWDVSQSYIDH
jgi:membrane protein